MASLAVKGLIEILLSKRLLVQPKPTLFYATLLGL